MDVWNQYVKESSLNVYIYISHTLWIFTIPGTLINIYGSLILVWFIFSKIAVSIVWEILKTFKNINLPYQHPHCLPNYLLKHLNCTKILIKDYPTFSFILQKVGFPWDKTLYTTKTIQPNGFLSWLNSKALTQINGRVIALSSDCIKQLLLEYKGLSQSGLECFKILISL